MNELRDAASVVVQYLEMRGEEIPGDEAHSVVVALQ